MIFAPGVKIKKSFQSQELKFSFFDVGKSHYTSVRFQWAPLQVVSVWKINV